MRPIEELISLLIAGSRQFGSLAGVAGELGVPPEKIYRWIAGTEQPSDEAIDGLVQKLRALLDFS
jgi:hypothetical protein